MIFIIRRHDLQRFAISQFREQALLEHMWIIGNQNIGGFQNTLGGTVILLKFDDL
ncbi:hypothetical protein SRABI106_02297 [Rahnella aquatilis]|nr:hypothetical protein SRABI106_02297 [Rahnella aquatilis]